MSRRRGFVDWLLLRDFSSGREDVGGVGRCWRHGMTLESIRMAVRKFSYPRPPVRTYYPAMYVQITNTDHCLPERYP